MNIKQHSLLCKKSIIKINIEENKDQLKDLYFYGNSCIKDIYRNLSKKNNSKNIVYYITNNKSENDEQYKALNEFDKKVILKISKKEIEKNISMLVKDGGLTQKFMDILKSWFKYFSKGKDQMTIPDLVECFNILTNKKFLEKSLTKKEKNMNSIRQRKKEYLDLNAITYENIDVEENKSDEKEKKRKVKIFKNGKYIKNIFKNKKEKKNENNKENVVEKKKKKLKDIKCSVDAFEYINKIQKEIKNLKIVSNK